MNVRGIGLALGLGIAGGAIAQRLGLPLPWMLGPMIATTAAAVAGLPVAAPAGIRPFVVPVIGLLLASGLTPETLARLPSLAAGLALLPFHAAAAMVASYAIYRRLGRFDRVTAYFAAAPGGLNDMLILADAAGGDGRRVALAHATRILVVVSCMALVFALVFGVTTGGTGGRPWTGFAEHGPRGLGLLAAAGLAGYLVGRWLNVPVAVLFAPMVIGGALYAGGAISLPPPSLLVIAAQVILGTAVGCRFAGTAARAVASDLALGAAASLAMLAVTVVFAELLARLTGQPPSLALLAYSPGGLSEMSLLAFALGQDAAFVALMHMARIVLVIVAVPVLFRRRQA